MKTHLGKFLGLAVLFAAISATAEVKASVTVPFAFNAGGQLCPAGEYDIAINKSDDVITFTRQGYRQAVVLGNASVSLPDGGSQLRFRQIGDQMFLQEVAVSGEGENLVLPKAARLNSEVAQSRARSADSGAGAR